MVNRVEEYRKKRGYSAEQLARKADVSRQTIVRVEKGSNVNIETAVAIAKALGEKFDTIFLPEV